MIMVIAAMIGSVIERLMVVGRQAHWGGKGVHPSCVVEDIFSPVISPPSAVVISPPSNVVIFSPSTVVVSPPSAETGKKSIPSQPSHTPKKKTSMKGPIKTVE